MNRLVINFSKKMSPSDKKLSQYVQKVDKKKAQRRALERTLLPGGDTIGILTGGVGGRKYHATNLAGTVGGAALGAYAGKKAVDLAFKGTGKAGKAFGLVAKLGAGYTGGKMGLIKGNQLASGYQYDKAKKKLNK